MSRNSSNTIFSSLVLFEKCEECRAKMSQNDEQKLCLYFWVKDTILHHDWPATTSRQKLERGEWLDLRQLCGRKLWGPQNNFWISSWPLRNEQELHQWLSTKPLDAGTSRKIDRNLIGLGPSSEKIQEKGKVYILCLALPLTLTLTPIVVLVPRIPVALVPSFTLSSGLTWFTWPSMFPSWFLEMGIITNWL